MTEPISPSRAIFAYQFRPAPAIDLRDPSGRYSYMSTASFYDRYTSQLAHTLTDALIGFEDEGDLKLIDIVRKLDCEWRRRRHGRYIGHSKPSYRQLLRRSP